jgi:hypothetical protein
MKATRPSVRLALAAACAFAATLSAAAPVAAALKPSQVAKVPGEAFTVRCSDNDWLACWSLQGDGNYKLFVVNGGNGDSKEVDSSAAPGGFCWLTSKNLLLYTVSKHITKPAEFNEVTYYLYNTGTGTKKKLTVIKDLIDTYQFDPISSDDGSRAFHMTIGSRSLPSFNLYLNDGQQILPRDASARIGSDYDLSSDGTTLYWMLEDTTNNSRSIVGWNLDANHYAELYEYPAVKDPSQSSAYIKVNSPRKQAATMAYSEKEAGLKLCVYNFGDPKNLSVIPVTLGDENTVLGFDWKGRSSSLYVLFDVANDGKRRKIIEWDVTSRKSTLLLDTTDAVESVDYASGSQTYYYSVVNAEGRNPQTLLMRLK